MSELRHLHGDLRLVARELLGAAPGREPAWSTVADAGWLSLEVPEVLDGAGATFAELVVVAEEVGRAAAAGPFLGPAVLGVGALLAVEPTEGRDALLRAVGEGTSRTAVALSATGDAPRAAPPFTLVGAGEGATLHGTARFVVDAPDADDLLLLATGGEGDPKVVRVTPGAVAVTRVPLVDVTRRVATVTADGVEVAAHDVWAFADQPRAAAQRLVDRAAVAVAADALGLGSAMLDATVAYVSDRHQFGRPVGSFQAVKHACADMLVAQSVGRELLDAAAEAVATGAPDAGAAVARAASSIGGATVDVVGAALQLHGGIGYTWESGIHTYLKRAVLDRSLFGSPPAHRRRLAAGLLTAT